MQAVLPQTTSSRGQRHGKYLTFQLTREHFGIPVLHVKEIIGVQDITAVPQTPAFLKGVINLRGRIVPVVDLRLKFRFEASVYDSTTCIIVVQVHRPDEVLQIGLIVDKVCEVLNLSASDIEDTPDFGQDVSTAHILGLAKVKGSVKILLDIDEVLTQQELRGLNELTAVVN